MRKIGGRKLDPIKTFILALFVLMQGYLIFIKKHESLDIDVFPGTIPAPNIFIGNRIGQTFIAQRDHLVRIDVLMGTHERVNDREITFTLRERKPKNRILRRTTFNAAEVIDNRYHPVRFDPVRDSKGKEYYFLFNSPESTPDNSVCIWMNEDNIYPDGQYRYRHDPQMGDLVFRVYSRRPISKELARVVRHYSGVFGSVAVLIGVIVIFVVVQVFILLKLLDVIFKMIKD